MQSSRISAFFLFVLKTQTHSWYKMRFDHALKSGLYRNTGCLMDVSITHPEESVSAARVCLSSHISWRSGHILWAGDAGSEVISKGSQTFTATVLKELKTDTDFWFNKRPLQLNAANKRFLSDFFSWIHPGGGDWRGDPTDNSATVSLSLSICIQGNGRPSFLCFLLSCSAGDWWAIRLMHLNLGLELVLFCFMYFIDPCGDVVEHGSVSCPRSLRRVAIKPPTCLQSGIYFPSWSIQRTRITKSNYNFLLLEIGIRRY